MKFRRFLVSFKVEAAGRLPGFMGNLTRGLLGRMLHRHDGELYRILFEKSLLRERFPTHTDFPSPFWLYVYNPPFGEYKTGDTFKFILSLASDYHQFMPRLEETFRQWAKSKEFPLPIQYWKSELLPSPHTGHPDIDWAEFKALSCTDTSITLKFQSPLIVEWNHCFAAEKIAGWLLMRFNLLNIYFGNVRPMAIPWHEDKTQIYALQFKRIILPHQHINGRSYKIKAWKGQITYYDRGRFASLYPLLAFGQHMQMGNRTSAGFGKYRLL